MKWGVAERKCVGFVPTSISVNVGHFQAVASAWQDLDSDFPDLVSREGKQEVNSFSCLEVEEQKWIRCVYWIHRETQSACHNFANLVPLKICQTCSSFLWCSHTDEALNDVDSQLWTSYISKSMYVLQNILTIHFMWTFADLPTTEHFMQRQCGLTPMHRKDTDSWRCCLCCCSALVWRRRRKTSLIFNNT